MKNKNAFEVTWKAEDGYVGGSRPHTIEISSDELWEDSDDKQIRRLFWDTILFDFEQKVSPYSSQEEEFVAWAKEQIAKMKEENDS